MFFFAIPAILETVLVVAASTIAAKAASDVYDELTTPKEDEDED